MCTSKPEGELIIYESEEDIYPHLLDAYISSIREHFDLPPIKIELIKHKRSAQKVTRGLQAAILEGVERLFGHDAPSAGQIQIARKGGFYLMGEDPVRLNHIPGLHISVISSDKEQIKHPRTLNATDCALLSVGFSLTNLKFIETALKGNASVLQHGWGLFQDDSRIFSFSPNSHEAELALQELCKMFHVEHGAICTINPGGVKLN